MLLDAVTTPTTAAATNKHSIESMSFLMVYNAHNGEVTKIPKPIRYHTTNDFKQYIVESFTNYLIDDAENVFLLTSFGIKLNFNIINEINEVYVFDKRMFINSNSLVNTYFEQNLGNFTNLMVEYKQLSEEKVLPDVTSNIKVMSSNLKRYQTWSQIFLNHCLKVNALIKTQYLKHLNNIFKSLNVIFLFINNFISEIEKGFNNYYNHVKLLNFKSLHKEWQHHYNNTKRFAAVHFKSSNKSVSLVSLLNYDKLVQSAEYVSENLPAILNKFNEMVLVINGINESKLLIDKVIESKRNESIKLFKVNLAEELCNEFRAKVDLASRSLESVESYNDSLELVYKQNQDYKNDLLSIARRINNCLNQTVDFKLGLLNTSFDILNQISKLQMEIVGIRNEAKVLSQPSSSTEKLSHHTVENIKKSEDYLSLTIDLPLLFGFILIEKRRQFEWYDFYSKGIINNITEQLMTIIDHEKIFQKLWLKRFGNYVGLLTGGESNSKPMLPNLDITLINNQQHQIIFQFLKDVEIERDDLLEYIKTTEAFESKYNPHNEGKFTSHLNKAFKDLVKSTNNMKSVTKLVTSISNFTSPNEDLSNSKLKKLIENDDEFNDNMIKGLKSRIRKLEDLLHQQQFKNLANWPVTRYPSGKGSPGPIASPPPIHSANQVTTKTKSVSPNTQSPNPNSFTSPSPTQKLNPTSLLRKNSNGAPLDASTTIDKHLDNIRLKKENKELMDENTRLRNDNLQKSLEIETLLKEIETLKGVNHDATKEIYKVKEEHDTRLKRAQDIHETKLEVKEKEARDLREQLSHDRAIIGEYKSIIDSKDSKIKSYIQDIERKLQEVSDIVVIKEDLISNMAAKESEYIKTANNYETEIKELKLKIEEITEDYENLIELTQQQSNSALIHELNTVIRGLLFDIKSSLDLNYQFFYEFCLVLESVGLLLVKEYNETLQQEEYKITRVKGLRSKKGDDANNTNGDILIISVDNKPSTKVINDINRLMEWLVDIKLDDEVLVNGDEDVKSLSTNVDEDTEEANEVDEEVSKSNELVNLFHTYFNSQAGQTSKFNELLHVISFANEDHEKFFLTAIAKRFRDVEGFAKKLTKENKTKTLDYNRLVKSSSNKISMNNFSVGDLALFLPTRIENLSEVQMKYQPWAAFNISAPHFFLNNIGKGLGNSNNKEWLVAKITDIKEFKVTESDINNEDTNPFRLSVGIVWYLVDAKEETAL